MASAVSLSNQISRANGRVNEDFVKCAVCQPTGCFFVLQCVRIINGKRSDKTKMTKNILERHRTVFLSLLMAAAVMMVIILMQGSVAYASNDIETPENFNAKKVGLFNKAKLTWDESEDASGYQIYRASGKHGKYRRIKKIGQHKESFTNSNLRKKAVYYYKIRAVGKNKKDVSEFSKAKKVVVKYKISNMSNVTAAQLARYYKKSGHIFPKYYKKTDTPTLKAFCQTYIDEARAEGIDAKVAFVQAMLETGWLKFGGDVSIKQNNFAGLGAVGGGARGNKFKTVKTGIRAHIQHLKAYANKKPLNNKCVDKRFTAVQRGCTPYVEWLGIGDNPRGYGWCAGSGYGYNIVKMISRIR